MHKCASLPSFLPTSILEKPMGLLFAYQRWVTISAQRAAAIDFRYYSAAPMEPVS